MTTASTTSTIMLQRKLVSFLIVLRILIVALLYDQSCIGSTDDCSTSTGTRFQIRTIPSVVVVVEALIPIVRVSSSIRTAVSSDTSWTNAILSTSTSNPTIRPPQPQQQHHQRQVSLCSASNSKYVYRPNTDLWPITTTTTTTSTTVATTATPTTSTDDTTVATPWTNDPSSSLPIQFSDCFPNNVIPQPSAAVAVEKKLNSTSILRLIVAPSSLLLFLLILTTTATATVPSLLPLHNIGTSTSQVLPLLLILLRQLLFESSWCILLPLLLIPIYTIILQRTMQFPIVPPPYRSGTTTTATTPTNQIRFLQQLPSPIQQLQQTKHYQRIQFIGQVLQNIVLPLLVLAVVMATLSCSTTTTLDATTTTTTTTTATTILPLLRYLIWIYSFRYMNTQLNHTTWGMLHFAIPVRYGIVPLLYMMGIVHSNVQWFTRSYYTASLIRTMTIATTTTTIVTTRYYLSILSLLLATGNLLYNLLQTFGIVLPIQLVQSFHSYWTHIVCQRVELYTSSSSLSSLHKQ
jgi:hypothetical protein